jgi:3-hydroxyacyl-[acyl-carrier-protein] dehydratase
VNQRPPPYAAPLTAVDALDAVTGADGRIEVTAVKLIVPADPYQRAHFPGRPVYPGVFVLETVCQAVLAAIGPGPVPVVTTVTSLRFFRPMVPGDRLRAAVVIGPPGEDGERRVTASCRSDDGTETARMSLTFGVRYAGPDPAVATAGPGPGPARGRTLGYEQIRAILPHGPQMVLVDQAEVSGDGRAVRAVKAVSGTEPCYQHLTPALPRERFAYPLSLIIESFGQAAAVLWRAGAGPPQGHLLMFAAARNWHFEGPVYPGDVLCHEVNMENSIASTGFASGLIWARGRRVATVGSVIAVLRPDGGPRSATSPEPVAAHVQSGS